MKWHAAEKTRKIPSQSPAMAGKKKLNPYQYPVQAFGYPAGFLTLAAVALAALAFFALLMPETGPDAALDEYFAGASSG